MPLLLEKNKKTRGQYNRKGDKFEWAPFKVLGITEEDVCRGLSHVKRVAKRKFRQKVKRVHPDMQARRKHQGFPLTGRSFRGYVKSYNMIKALECMPINLRNMNSVLEINKGYIGTNDIDLPGFI